jgi:hypothetical protein
MYELRANMSISAVAEWLDIDPGTVREAEKRIFKAKYRHIDLKKTRIIDIDELYVFGRERPDRKPFSSSVAPPLTRIKALRPLAPKEAEPPNVTVTGR